MAGQLDSASAAVLTGLASGGFVTTAGGQPAKRATLAVVIIPATPPSASDSNVQSQTLITLAQQLNLAGQGTVVAGSIAGSGPGSTIHALRAGNQAPHLSTVDDADYPIGQITVVQALFEGMHHKSGSYGALSTANSAGPSPGPTASPTASATPAPAGTRGGQPVASATGSATP